ncbi:alpha/beta hydrolase [uncultured Roseobacter sp.]|uniref:alpha/beta fold hydrolase n=1 Tax=uncultured Roseobacter sp. TaxID=114847 RepID=UPI0026260363|nr:alpha/beta hydrolase [uncultured Roseobacter sp.]
MIWTTRPRSDGAGGLAYWTQGSGPALILIHGVGLRAEAWAAMMPALAGHFTVYALDMPGHGFSPRAGETDLGDYTARAGAFIDALQEPVCLAGHSMGAMIALALGAKKPRQISGVAAISAIYRRSPDAAQAVQARAKALQKADAPDPTATLERWFGNAPQGDGKQAAEACRAWLSDADPAGYAAAYSVFAHHDGPSDDDLRNLTCPTLFMTGGQDPNSTAEMSEEMAARCPRGRCVVLEDAAHMLPMTHPDAAVDAILSTFKTSAP